MSSPIFGNLSETLSSVAPAPCLPPELINEILCITALKSNRSERACLLSLSKGIYDIVSSVVYQILAPKESDMHYHGETYTSIEDFEHLIAWVDSKSSSFLSRTVKAFHLNLYAPRPSFRAEDWTKLFNRLTGVQIMHLCCVYWSDHDDIDDADRCWSAVPRVIFQLPNLRTLLFPWSNDGPNISIRSDLEQPLLGLNCLTHLIITRHIVSTKELLLFVSLTHLAIVYQSSEDKIEPEHIIQYEKDLKMRLQVLIFLWDLDPPIPAKWVFPEANDCKIVTLVVEYVPLKDGEYRYLQDWFRDDVFAGVDGRTTMWTRAEDILARRRT
ncbi:hypothetical protein DL96DRAFT_1626158 [Flagelloscypha sp. PMI_526]|nr:hypothetical protein DL96DRAFT_1626158 [Flagelloscypha sp. PMI_526]